MDDWQAWIGRGEQREDHLSENLLRRWLATLDREFPTSGAVPQAFHWCLCLPDAATALLGNDGHPRNIDNPDGYLPPIPLPRRMWASSKVAFHKPLRPGERVTRTTRVVSVNEKHGTSGRLVFVDVRHDTHGPDGLAVGETQTIVYREPSAPEAAPAPPVRDEGRFDPTPWDDHRALVPTETLLFRYSALTFNSHRIHYDLPYATREEGYRGLVVHGPLTATLLLDLAQRRFGDNALRRFDFRGLSPAICGEELHLVLRGTDSAIELGAFAAAGRQVMAATASV